MTAPVCPSSTANCLPFAESQIRAVLSLPAVMIRFESGENSAEFTRPSWPVSDNAATHSPRVLASFPSSADWHRAITAISEYIEDSSNMAQDDQKPGHASLSSAEIVSGSALKTRPCIAGLYNLPACVLRSRLNC